MLKKLLLLIPLIAPTVAYLAYAWVQARRRAAGSGAPPGWWQEGPWLWLFAAGVGLLAIVLGIWAVQSGEPAGSVYIPPSFEDGEILPGHHEPGIAPSEPDNP
ncbi:MAG: hypothetical protein RID91_00030 [Azospirillaceae bacterium]